MMTCLITSKIYIGSTNDPERRIGEYRTFHCKKQIKLYRSLMKYGFENHLFEVIWTGDIEYMYEKECILGNWYEVLDNKKGLTLRLPNMGDKYQSFSEEARKNMSDARKDWKPKPESIEKMRATKKRIGITPENKAKMVANLPRGKARSQEVRDKISEGNKGKIASDETRWKMSDKLICTETGRVMTPKEVAALYNVSASHISNMMRGDKTNKTTFIPYIKARPIINPILP